MQRFLPFLVMSLAGCDALPTELRGFLPTVRFDTLNVDSIDFEDAAVDFVFQVDNPNPIDIELASFSYALGLADTPLFDGDNEDGFALQAEGPSELRLPVTLNWQSTYETITATRGLDVVGFGLQGDFGFDTNTEQFGVVEIPYDESGDFPALRTPKFSFNSVRAGNVDFSNFINPTIPIEVELGIDNEHASSLFFDNFDYGLSLNGSRVASGLVPTFDVAGATDDGSPEGGQGKLMLPLNLSLLDVGTGIFDLISGGGQVNLGLDASMDVDTPFGVVPLSITEQGVQDILSM